MEERELLSSLVLDGQATLKDDTAAWLAEQGCPALSEGTLQALYGHELQPLWSFIREHRARACKASKCHSPSSLLQPALQPVNLEPEVRPEPRWYQELEHLQGTTVPKEACPPVTQDQFQELLLHTLAERQDRLAAFLHLLTERLNSARQEAVHKGAQDLVDPASNQLSAQGEGEAYEPARVLKAVQECFDRQMDACIKDFGNAGDFAAACREATTAIDACKLRPWKPLAAASLEAMDEASRRICLATKELDIVEDARRLRLQAAQDAGAGSAPGSALDVEERMHEARQAHVRAFFAAQESLRKERDAATLLGNLSSSLHRLCGGSVAGELRKRLLSLVSDVAGVQTAIAILESELTELGKQRDECAALQKVVAYKRHVACQTRERLQAMDELIAKARSTNASFGALWTRHRGLLGEFLENEIGLHEVSFAALTKQVGTMLAEESRLAAEVARRVVPAPRKEGAAAPAKTAARLEQELERVEASTQALKDSAAALKGSMLLADAGPAAAVALEHGSLPQRAAEREARLRAAVQAGSAALAQAQGPVQTTLQEWWEQPAVAAVPWITHGGRNAADWLCHVRALHSAAQAPA